MWPRLYPIRPVEEKSQGSSVHVPELILLHYVFVRLPNSKVPKFDTFKWFSSLKV